MSSLEKQIDIETAPVLVPFEFGMQPEMPEIAVPPAQSKVICIASGKGGTGKTTFTTNLAITLQNHGVRVLIVDADFGLANDHLLLGIEPHGDISDVLGGRKDIREVIIQGPGGIHLIPGGMGSSDLSDLENYNLRILAREIGSLESEYDVILFDLAAGVSPQIMRFLKPAHEIIIVTNPEVTALLDAYGLIKCLALQQQSETGEVNTEVQVVMNRVRDREEAIGSMQKLRHTAAKHLGAIRLNYLGYIPFDRYLLHSIAIQKPAVLSHPRAFVTSCLKAVEERILSRYRAWARNQEFKNPLPSYFAKLEQYTYE